MCSCSIAVTSLCWGVRKVSPIQQFFRPNNKHNIKDLHYIFLRIFHQLRVVPLRNDQQIGTYFDGMMSTWLIYIFFKSLKFSWPSWCHRAAYHLSTRYDYDIQPYGFEMNPSLRVAIANDVNLYFIFKSCHRWDETSDSEQPLLSFINKMTESIGATPQI